MYSPDNRPDLFAALVDLSEDLLAAATLLHQVLLSPSLSRMEEDLKHIRSLEDASNATIREVVRGLDLEDDSGPLPALPVTILLRYLDGAMDAMDEAAGFLGAYAVDQSTEHARGLASFLVRAAEGLLHCVTGLRNREDISDRVRVVDGVEDEADQLYRAAVGYLMAFGDDPLHALRWKDIYDRLEAAIDRLEEAAQFLGSMGIRRDAEAAVAEETDGGSLRP